MVATSLLVALVVLVVASTAETLHARRVSRVAFLAFGPSGGPSDWTRVAPILRAASVTALAWGACILAMHDPVSDTDRPPREECR